MPAKATCAENDKTQILKVLPGQGTAEATPPWVCSGRSSSRQQRRPWYKEIVDKSQILSGHRLCSPDCLPHLVHQLVQPDFNLSSEEAVVDKGNKLRQKLILAIFDSPLPRHPWPPLCGPPSPTSLPPPAFSVLQCCRVHTLRDPI